MTACCDLHNARCEPPSELCCRQCPEATHPQHAPGVICILEWERLHARLKAAEDACVLYGWTGVQRKTERGKALYQLWLHWADLVPPDFLGRDGHPDLSDEVLFTLATEQDLVRYTTLRRIQGETP